MITRRPPHIVNTPEPIRVLFLDDHPEYSAQVAEIFRQAGYASRLIQAHNLAEFRKALLEQKFDLILASQTVDGTCALDALAELQQFGMNFPFIVLADDADGKYVIDAVRAGANDIVTLSMLGRLPAAVRYSLEEKNSLDERHRMERVQSALVQLSQITLEASNLDELYSTIHAIVSSLMSAKNFYISLYDETTGMVSYPYYIDEYDTTPPPEPLSHGLTAYMIRTGRPLLATPEVFDRLVEAGEVELEGAASIDWLGVPLKVNGATIGVLAVQSYNEGVRFTHEDQQILEFVSNQIGMAIHRKRAEAALEAESRFRKAIENSILAGVMATDLEGRQSYVNPAFCRMVGWTEAELLGAMPPFAYWPEEEIESITDAFSVATSEEGLPSDFELIFQRRNGERFDAYLLVSPLTGEDGRLTGWLSSVYDVTARKQSEENARRQKARAEALARIASRLNARLNLQAVYNTVCEETARALNTPISILLVFDPENRSLKWGAGCGVPDHAGGRFQPIKLKDERVEPAEFSGTFQILDLQALTELSDVQLIAELKIRSCAGLWLAQGGRPLGLLLAVDRVNSRKFSEEEMAVLQGVGDQAIQAIVNARMFNEIELRLEQLRALHDVDQAISASMDLRITLNVLLDHMLKLLSVDAVDVLLYNGLTQELEFTVGRGFRSVLPMGYRSHVTTGYASRAVLGRGPVLYHPIDESHLDPELLATVKREGFVAYYGAPLLAKGQVNGVLEILSRSPIQISPEWSELVEAFIGQAAIAVDNVTLFKDLQRTNDELVAAYDSTLEGWVRALEIRDCTSSGQIQRVVDLTLELSRRLGLKDEELIHIRRGALLHDIGNIGVPDHILQKAGRLTDDELEIMRRHPVYGYEILSPITYLRNAVDIPYCHHERWDGSGYPRRLRGAEIPQTARIFAVVDVWDALTTDRPYRQAWSLEQARLYLIEQAGKQFDPDVVRTFLAMV